MEASVLSDGNPYGAHELRPSGVCIEATNENLTMFEVLSPGVETLVFEITVWGRISA